MPRPMNQTGYVPPKDTPLGHPDPRNHVLALAESIPLTKVTDLSALPVLNQKQTPSCVAHAITKVVMYYIWKKTGNVIKLSPRFLYALCKANDGMPNEEGTSFLVGLKMAQKYGICEDKYFPNDTTLPLSVYQNANLIPDAAFTNAALYKIGEYQFLPDHAESTIEAAIAQYDMVLIGIVICNSWWTSIRGIISWAVSDILPLRPTFGGDPTQSNHLVSLYGYNQFLHVAHDWSPLWAAKGFGWFGTNDLPYVYEAAVITDVLYPPTPAPAPPKPETLWDIIQRWFHA